MERLETHGSDRKFLFERGAEEHEAGDDFSDENYPSCWSVSHSSFEEEEKRRRTHRKESQSRYSTTGTRRKRHQSCA